MIMPTKNTVRNNARRQVRKALRSARYAVERLERIADDMNPGVCTDIARDAETALRDGAEEAKLAASDFGLLEMLGCKRG
jgi:hypothetical protein